MLLFPLHEVKIPYQDRHVIIVGVHITVGSRLVGVLVILEPDPLVTVMVMGEGTPGHRDTHPGKPLNHSVVRRCWIVHCLPVKSIWSVLIPV